MEKSENVVKFTISMEQDLHDWVQLKVVEMNAKDRRLKSSRSAIIADAVQTMKESEEQGKALAGAGAVIQPASGTSASGISTPTKKNTRRTG